MQATKQIVRGAVLQTIAALLVMPALAGEQWVLDLNRGKGQVEFNAVGKPKMLKIHGKGAAPKGVLAVSNGVVSGKATFDLKSLDTGIELRDSHMKDKYLEVGKYPNAVLEITEIKLPNPMPASDFAKDVPFKGKMTVKGSVQAVSGIAKLKKEGPLLKGQVEFTTTVKGFNIDIPSFAGVTMADEVHVQVEFSGPLTRTSQSLANAK